MIGNYRKKPVVVQAIQFFSGGFDYNADEAMKFCRQLYLDAEGPWRIRTLEGNMIVTSGDYIIKGVKGEFYPCKPDIFEQSYEQVND